MRGTAGARLRAGSWMAMRTRTAFLAGAVPSACRRASWGSVRRRRRTYRKSVRDTTHRTTNGASCTASVSLPAYIVLGLAGHAAQQWHAKPPAAYLGRLAGRTITCLSWQAQGACEPRHGRGVWCRAARLSDRRQACSRVACGTGRECVGIDIRTNDKTSHVGARVGCDTRRCGTCQRRTHERDAHRAKRI